MSAPAFADLPAPVMVLHMGASGSRLLVEVLENAGVFMGGTEARDEWREMAPFNTGPAGLADQFRYLHPWPADWRRRFATHAETITATLRASLPPLLAAGGYRGGPWGFKSPRALFLATVYLSLWPHARIVHLVRDGRDVALSQMAGIPRLPGCGDDVPASLQVWRAHQDEIRRVSAAHGCAMTVVRYEDLCTDTGDTAARLGAFLSLPPPRVDRPAAIHASTARIGKWRGVLPDAAWRPHAPALAEWGYEL